MHQPDPLQELQIVLPQEHQPDPLQELQIVLPLVPRLVLQLELQIGLQQDLRHVLPQEPQLAHQPEHQLIDHQLLHALRNNPGRVRLVRPAIVEQVHQDHQQVSAAVADREAVE